MARVETEIVVVGAGIAGLTAADRLHRDGVDVVVVEARERVGGRTWNTEIGGQANELGGQWIAPYQDAAHSLLGDLGLELFESHRIGDRVYVGADGAPRRYRGHDAPLGERADRSYARAMEKLEAIVAEVDPERPWVHPNARDLDATTFESWLRAEVDDDTARGLLRGFMAGGFMTKPAECFSVLGAAWVAAGAGSVDNLFEPELCLHSRVVGGSQLIAIRLAERVGWDRVHLGRPAREIRWSDTRVEVTAGTDTFTGRSAIVAIPPNLTSSIRFDPVLPSWRLRLEQSVSQGVTIKFLAVYDHPFWREDGLSGEGFAPYDFAREVYDNSPPSAEPGVLCTFLSGEVGEHAARLSPSERRTRVIDGFARYFGPQAREVVDVHEVDWTAEEYTRGAFSATFGPGGLVRFGSDLRRPVGPIHWANSDFSGVGNMHMDGAILSGQAAADAVR
ncbi:MAG: flavin monoamine oxidase family protein [Gaiella sp.]